MADFALSDSQLAALIGAMVGGGIAVVSQCGFFVLDRRRQIEEQKREMTRRRLDEFYSPMLSRLLEIEYKLWLDIEVRQVLEKDEVEGTKITASERTKREHLLQDWNRQIGQEIGELDNQVIELFRQKRWLAYDSTLIECQRLIQFVEASKLTQSVSLDEIRREWGDVARLQGLHKDVRKYHGALMERLGMHKCSTASLIPDKAGKASVNDNTAFERYTAHVEQRGRHSGSQEAAKGR